MLLLNVHIIYLIEDALTKNPWEESNHHFYSMLDRKFSFSEDHSIKCN